MDRNKGKKILPDEDIRQIAIALLQKRAIITPGLKVEECIEWVKGKKSILRAQNHGNL